MKRTLQEFELGEIRRPRKGEWFIAVKNCGGKREIVQASHNYKRVVVQIVKEK